MYAETCVYIDRAKYDQAFQEMTKRYGPMKKSTFHSVVIWHIARLAQANNLPVLIDANEKIPYSRRYTPDSVNSIGKFRMTARLSVAQKRLLRNTAQKLGTNNSALFNQAIGAIVPSLQADPKMDAIYRTIIVVAG